MGLHLQEVLHRELKTDFHSWPPMNTKGNPPKPWDAIEVSPKGGNSSKGGTSLTFRPHHLAKIGEIITCWSNIDHYLTETFAYLIEAEGWTAAELFENVRQFQSKGKIIRTYMNQKLGSPGRALADQATAPLELLNRARNDIAHGFFIVRSDYPDGVIRVVGWGKSEQHYLYRQSTIDALAEQFYACETGVRNMWLTVISSVPPRNETGRLIAANPNRFRAIGPEGNETLEFLQDDGTWLRPGGTTAMD